MGKRALVAAVVVPVLIFIGPAGYAAMAESNSNPDTTQSTSNAPKADPAPPEPTAREMGCSQSQIWKEKCEKAAEMCIYKLRVDKVNEGPPQKLDVTYPESVWQQSKAPTRDKEAEATQREYREKYKGMYNITIKRSESPIKKGKVYLFTRCTDNGRDDNGFTLLQELPDEKPKRGGSRQTAQ